MILNIVDHHTKQIHLFLVTSQITADGVASIYFDHVFPLHRCKGVHSLMPDLGCLWLIADLLQLRPGFHQRYNPTR